MNRVTEEHPAAQRVPPEVERPLTPAPVDNGIIDDDDAGDITTTTDLIQIEQAAARSRGLPGTHPAKRARASSRVKLLLNGLLVISDLIALVLAFMTGYVARMALPFLPVPLAQPPFIGYLPTLTLHVVTIMSIFYISRLYHQRRSVSRIDQGRNIMVAVTVGAFMTMGIQEFIFKNTFFDSVDYPRSMFFYVWMFSFTFTIVGRELLRAVRRQFRARGIEADNLLIIGAGKTARFVSRKVRGNPQLGYHAVGIVTPRPSLKASFAGLPVLGEAADLPRLIDEYKIEQVIIALPEAARDTLAEMVALCQRGRVDIKIYPDAFAYIAREISVDELDGAPLITVRDIALRGWKLSLKRALDVFGAVVGLVLLSPWLLLTAFLIRFESPGPVFYSQERMGLDGKPFQMIKFRSMRQDAEKTGAGWTVKGDPRVTRVGKFMRATSWDEIPQLINVLVGEMSLVGPRPERPVYVQQFREKIPRYMERLREKAGMTGWAQVNGLRGDTSIEDRTQYDLWYVENWSLWLDLKIIIRTVLNIVLRKDENAY